MVEPLLTDTFCGRRSVSGHLARSWAVFLDKNFFSTSGCAEIFLEIATPSSLSKKNNALSLNEVLWVKENINSLGGKYNQVLKKKCREGFKSMTLQGCGRSSIS